MINNDSLPIQAHDQRFSCAFFWTKPCINVLKISQETDLDQNYRIKRKYIVQKVYSDSVTEVSHPTIHFLYQFILCMVAWGLKYTYKKQTNKTRFKSKEKDFQSLKATPGRVRL